MADHQPTGLVSGNGCMCTIGMYVNAEPCAIVLPMVADASIDKDQAAFRLNEAVKDQIFPVLLPILAPTAWITFVSSDGMVDGIVPDREDYPPTAYPGGASGTTTLPTSNALLLFFYEDSGDVAGGGRIRLGKNYIPGCPRDELVGDSWSEDIQALALVVAQTLRDGITDSEGAKWYRVLASPKRPSPSVAVKRIFNVGVRGYVCTQKRRLLPRV